MTPCLKNALHYAQYGWKVFPALYDAKTKRHKGLVKWSFNASCDFKQIEAWGKKFPRAYFCVALKQSDLTVIDVDNKMGKKGFDVLASLTASNSPLPQTLTAATPSGGRHYVFKGFTRHSVSTLGKGIDTPVMIPLPGSDVPGKGAYRIIDDHPPAPIPQWVVDLLGRQQQRSKDHRIPAVIEDQPEHILDAIDYAANAQPSIQGDGGDNQLYLTACKIRDFGVSSAMCLAILEKYFNPRCSPPWDADELETKVSNVYAYARSRAGENLPEVQFAPQTKNLPAKTADLLRVSDIPPLTWILGYRLAVGYLTVTIAPGGVGKSALTILEGISVAANRNLTGQKVHLPGGVWIYSTEDPEDELERRIAAACLLHGINLADLTHLHYTSGQTRPLVLVKDDKRKGLVVNHLAIEQITNYIEQHEIRVLVVDPFLRTHQVNENDNIAIDMVAQWFARIAKITRCAVSLVHHANKKNSSGNIRGEANSARGATALVNAARIAHTLDGMTLCEAQKFGLPTGREKWFIRLDRAKANLAPPGEEVLWYEKVSVDLFRQNESSIVALRQVNPQAQKNRGDLFDAVSAIAECMQQVHRCRLVKLARKIQTDYSHLFGGKHEDTMVRLVRRALTVPKEINGMRIWYQEEEGGHKKQHWVYREMTNPQVENG